MRGKVKECFPGPKTQSLHSDLRLSNFLFRGSVLLFKSLRRQGDIMNATVKMSLSGSCLPGGRVCSRRAGDQPGRGGREVERYSGGSPIF